MAEQYNIDITPTGHVANYKRTQNGRVQHTTTESTPAGTYVLQPNERLEFHNGQVAIKVGENRIEDINNHLSQAIGGTHQLNQGSYIKIVGSKDQFAQDSHAYLNKQAEALVAQRANKPEKAINLDFSFVKELSQIPSALTEGITKIPNDLEGIKYQPTGCIAQDAAMLAEFYVKKLQSISITGIAHRALLIIRAEAERIEAQFENCISLDLSWLDLKSKKPTNPSTQNNPEKAIQSFSDAQKAASENLGLNS